MKAVIQRVLSASVDVEGERISAIGCGVLTFLGVECDDGEKELDWMIAKISKLRIFADQAGKMNLSLLDLKAEHLIVSQFTLCGETSQGNRPGFTSAAAPDVARALYERAIEKSRALGLKTGGGQFQADMKVSLINDGPVTFILESP